MVHAFLSCGKFAAVVQTAAERPTTVTNVLNGSSFQLGVYNLGLISFENDFLVVSNVECKEPFQAGKQGTATDHLR